MMEALRVCHAIGTSDIGGTERFLLDLLRRHRDLGIESNVCVMDGPGPLASSYETLASSVEYLFVSESFGRARRQWGDFLDRTRPAVVVLYGARANLLGRVVRGAGKPTVIAALRSTRIDDAGSRFAPLLDRMTFGRVSACVSNSRVALDDLLARGYPADRLAYIPPGINLATFASRNRETARAALGVAASDLVLLSVANLKPVKNQSLLIDVSARLAARGVAHRLWLVGDGPDRARLEAQVRREHRAPHFVEFLGREADPSVRFAAADLFVLSSNWEGAPTAVLEAMAAGVPVVATDVGDVRDFVDDTVGRTVSAGNATALLEAVTIALDPSVRAQWAAVARQRSVSFSADTMAVRYAELFAWAATRTGPLPAAYRPPVPRRVVRVLSRLNVGGPTVHVVLLSRLMASEQVQTVLVAGRVGHAEGDMSYFAAEQGVSVHTIPSLGRSVSPLKDLLALVTLFRLLRQVRPDVVHTHASKGGAIGRAAAILYNLWPFRGRVAIVHTYHGHTFEGYFGRATARIFRWIERVLASLTDRIIVLSHQQFDDIVGRFKIVAGHRARIVPLGLDLRAYFAVDGQTRERARLALGFSTGQQVIVSVGRLTPIKNHELLLRAFLDASRSLPDAFLVLAGDGELRTALEDRSAALGIADRVRFLGWRRDLPDLYAAADVAALSSNNEGTPVALIEAIAAGCPVVATRVGGVPDVVDAGCGILVPAGDDGALAEALVAAARRDRLPTDVRHRMRRFGIERLVGDLLSLYREILQPSTARESEAR